MDTPNLPENEPEEITWQDDENRATLFLRSVFVLLSGALILGVLLTSTVVNPFTGFIIVILPVFVIWFFFGQGLRPVEWLSNQKYNAWNYGVSFIDWKTHFRWMIVLVLVGIVEAIFFRKIDTSQSPQFSLSAWFGVILPLWIIGICLTWFIWGYLWFGCAQGFGAIAATAVIIISIGCIFLQNIQPINTALLASAYFIPLALLCSYICWKQKSWIPILYAVILLAPIASFILIY